MKYICINKSTKREVDERNCDYLFKPEARNESCAAQCYFWRMGAWSEVRDKY